MAVKTVKELKEELEIATKSLIDRGIQIAESIENVEAKELKKELKKELEMVKKALIDASLTSMDGIRKLQTTKTGRSDVQTESKINLSDEENLGQVEFKSP